MPSQLSPGVVTNEINLTTIVPAVSTSIGGLAGVFRWGPVGQRIEVASENILAATFQKPTNLKMYYLFRYKQKPRLHKLCINYQRF